jgi:hypothetical protein
MTRKEELGLGVGLILLGLVGLIAGASTWLCAANLLAAIWALVTALVVRPDQHGDIAVGLPIVLALSLLLIWLCAFTAHATPWLTWLTLGAAVAAAVEADDAMPGGVLRHIRH